jgi:hypothetical protein
MPYGGMKERFQDQECLIEFEELSGRLTPFYNVYGKGESEYGTFLLHGTFDAATRMIELTRQYLAENDERKNLSFRQLKQQFKFGSNSIQQQSQSLLSFPHF